MIVPDLQMICENMLMSEGFSMAKGLSKQYHYDFKLRALKSVLVMAGDLKRASADLPEDVVLMRALRDMNMPKFVKADVPLFQGLLGDLFPGLDCPRVGHAQLQVDKVMQLYETMLTRHTTMVVGRTGGGKSVVLDALCAGQKKGLNLPTKLFPINPKAIT